jgi:4-amino-4-deoxy-L-arabinose transferase-like glycosyltransferase
VNRAATWIAIVAAVGVAALGLWKGTYSAGNGDPFGYVSQADLIARGSLHVEQQFVRAMPWPYADWSFAPAGYRPGTARGTLVPVYPFGLPLTMAVFQKLAGPMAVFFVVPLLGALCVWMTAQLGAIVHGRLTGMLAALMLAASPSFQFQLMQPMSDVPAAAWWTLALVLVLRYNAPAALLSGLAASAAIITRPNLVPLAAVIGSYLLVRVFRSRDRASVIQLACFATASAVGCVAVAVINNRLYGSPLSSGYEPFGSLYSFANVGPNLDRFPRWLLHTQTPFILLAAAAPWFARRPKNQGSGIGDQGTTGTGLLLPFIAVVFLSYVFYRPFERDNWTYLRFLLPAYPALIVLAIAVAFEAARRLLSDNGRAITAALVLCLVVTAWLGRESIVRGVLRQQEIDSRYRDVGRYVSAILPANSVLIGHLHAGSIRHYSGRLTMNYLWVGPGWLDHVIKELRALGYHPLIALEVAEIPSFQARFAEQNVSGRLDWPPMASRSETVQVQIFDPADRERHLRGEQVTTGTIVRVRRW